MNFVFAELWYSVAMPTVQLINLKDICSFFSIMVFNIVLMIDWSYKHISALPGTLKLRGRENQSTQKRVTNLTELELNSNSMQAHRNRLSLAWVTLDCVGLRQAVALDVRVVV